MPYFLLGGLSLIKGPASDYASLPTPASSFSGQLWYVATGSGGFFSSIGAYKYPKGVYSPNTNNMWELVPLNVKVAEDSTTLINIVNWAEFYSYAFDVSIGDRVIFNGVTFKNITGNMTSTNPSLDATNWDNAFPQGTIFVAKKGGDFKTIKEACDSVSGNSASNPFFINVAPDEYFEDPFLVPDYTIITLNNAVVKPNSLTGDFIGLGSSADISNGNIDNLTNTGAAIYSSGSVGCASHRIDVTGGTTGFLSINGGQLTVTNCSTRSMANGFWVDNAILVTIACSATLVANGIRASGVGVIVGSSFGVLGGSIFDILQSDATASIRIANALVSMDRISAINWALVKLTIVSDKEDDEAFAITQELQVGLPELGQESCLGEGDSYTRGMLVYTETELGVFTDVSESAASPSGSTVTFTGVTEDNSIYVASTLTTLSDFLQPTGIKTKLDAAVVLGGGEIIPEYWNGSNWVEASGFEAESSGQYLPHANNYFEHTGSHHIRFSNEFSDGLWVKSDPMSLGTDYYWGRFRIAVAITTSPILQQIKLHSNRTEVNGDGWQEFYGKARPIGQLPLNLELGRPFEGNMQSQEIYINQDIGVGYTENKFTATGDKLGVAGFLPFDLDTSCPIKLGWSGQASNTSPIQWTVRWGWVTDGDAYYTAEPSLIPGSKIMVFDDSTVAGEVKRFEASLDVKEMIARRPTGFGDELWISIQPSILSGTFSLTTSQATYTKWSSGGHI